MDCSEFVPYTRLTLLTEHVFASHVSRLSSDLGILSIERDRFSEIDKRKVLEMSAQRKARKVKILQS